MKWNAYSIITIFGFLLVSLVLLSFNFLVSAQAISEGESCSDYSIGDVVGDYYCGEDEKWHTLKNDGSSCDNDFECKIQKCIDGICQELDLDPGGLDSGDLDDVNKGLEGSLVCGNGVCQVSETPENCPQDCVVDGEVCGDGDKEGAEECDDGNLDNGDGCSAICEIETPSGNVCGDGIKAGAEECDDGNLNNDDGCDSSCDIEDGYICVEDSNGKSTCANCGDDICVEGIENENNCPHDCHGTGNGNGNGNGGGGGGGSAPSVVIISPKSIHYDMLTIPLIVEDRNKVARVWKYKLNDGSKVTFSPESDPTITAREGANELTVFALTSATAVFEYPKSVTFTAVREVPIPRSECGDDMCSEDEDRDSCPEDCKPGINPVFWWLLLILIILILVALIVFIIFMRKKKEVTPESEKDKMNNSGDINKTKQAVVGKTATTSAKPSTTMGTTIANSSSQKSVQKPKNSTTSVSKQMTPRTLNKINQREAATRQAKAEKSGKAVKRI